MKWGKQRCCALVLVRGSMDKVNAAIPKLQEMAEYNAGTEEIFKADLFENEDPSFVVSDCDSNSVEEDSDEDDNNKEEPLKKRQRLLVDSEIKKLQVLKKNKLDGQFLPLPR